MHRTNRTLVALKRILMHIEKEGMPVTALREIKILKALKHPAIVELLDMFVVPSKQTHLGFPFEVIDSLEQKATAKIPCHAIWFFPTWTMIWLVFWRTNGFNSSPAKSNCI